MGLSELEQILSAESGSKFCPICDTPFTPHNSRQKTCGAPECKREWHNKYMRERTKRLQQEDRELWRKYHRDAQRKSRAKKKERIERDAELKRLQKSWERQAEFDRKIAEYGLDYGSVQAQKILEKVPKIDVNLGGNHDNVHDKDSR